MSLDPSEVRSLHGLVTAFSDIRTRPDSFSSHLIADNATTSGSLDLDWTRRLHNLAALLPARQLIFLIALACRAWHRPSLWFRINIHRLSANLIAVSFRSVKTSAPKMEQYSWLRIQRVHGLCNVELDVVRERIMACRWRDYVKDGHQYRMLSDFGPDMCVLISPRCAQMKLEPGFMPQFRIRTRILRHIVEEFHGVHIPRTQSFIFHACVDVAQRHSLGLCINPLHLRWGDKADARSHAQRRRRICHEVGLWMPRDLVQAFDAEPTATENTEGGRFSLHSPLTLADSAERRAYQKCSQFYLNTLSWRHPPVLRDFVRIDWPLLKQVTYILEQIQKNSNTSLIQRLLEQFTRTTWPRRRRTQCCHAHR